LRGHQADQLPDVVRANINVAVLNKRQTYYMPHIDDVPPCPEDCAPDPEWETKVIASFSELRTLLGCFGARGNQKRSQPVPPMRDIKSWHLFCLGSELKSDGESDTEEAEDNSEHENTKKDLLEKRRHLLCDEFQLDIIPSNITNDSTEPTSLSSIHTMEATTVKQTENTCEFVYAVGTPPTPSLLLQFDQVMTQRVLSHHVQWLDTRSLSVTRAAWIYALLARLEKPLFQDTVAVLRHLYRVCCQQRLALSSEILLGLDERQEPSLQTSGPEESEREREREREGVSNQTKEDRDLSLASLNLIIALTGSYFGQGESYSDISPSHELNTGNNQEDMTEVFLSGKDDQIEDNDEPWMDEYNY